MSIDPKQVISPVSHLSDLKVIVDQGVGEYSIALLNWDGEKRIGARWNGTADNRVGNPQSRGIPTWFILPDVIAESYLAEMLKNENIPEPIKLDIKKFMKEN